MREGRYDWRMAVTLTRRDEGIGPLTLRLCSLQAARMAGGAVLLLPAGTLPETGGHYCGWPVLRCGVPEPMIGLPGRERGTG
jgi:hypothetical protein